MEYPKDNYSIFRKITYWLFVLSDIAAYLLSAFLLVVALAYPFVLLLNYGGWQALTLETIAISIAVLLLAILAAAVTRRSIVVTLLVIIILAIYSYYWSWDWYWLAIPFALIIIFSLPLILSFIEYQYNKFAKNNRS